MTREESIEVIKQDIPCEHDADLIEALEMAIQALSQEPICDRDCEHCTWTECPIEPCDDAVSRQAVEDAMYDATRSMDLNYGQIMEYIDKLPSIKPQEPKTGHCKDCKYFEYDSVAKVDGIPLIVAHEICNKWGEGCKTKEDGYCFLFEPQERSEE